MTAPYPLTSPMRHLTPRHDKYILEITLRRGVRFRKSLSLEEALEMRAELEYEREFHRRLGLR